VIQGLEEGLKNTDLNEDYDFSVEVKLTGFSKNEIEKIRDEQ